MRIPMMKCKGHIHNERHQGRIEPCTWKIRKVGFERGDDDKIAKENFICDNQRCSLYKNIQVLEPEGEE